MPEPLEGCTRRIDFHPAFDKRDPDPHKNYGIHGVDMRWYVIGAEGAIQFVVYTNWMLRHVEKELDAKPINPDFPHLGCRPMAADIGYHGTKPMYDGQRTVEDDCPIIGGPCYYDGSGLQAEHYFDILREQGGDALWIALEEYYVSNFRSTE